MSPDDVRVLESLTYISSYLGASPVRVLDVGCGRGELAKRLRASGHDVVGVDTSEEAIRTARRAGIDARVAEWPKFDEAPFDVVIFSRSLHHMAQLDAAVARARELLKPGGKIIVEDFAVDEIHPLAAEWVYQCGIFCGQSTPWV